MTFTKPENSKQRQAFIEDCRQKAWGAACHADWIGKQLDTLLTDYTKLKEEDAKLEAEIKMLETAMDYHTVENREKRKALQERRSVNAKQIQGLNTAMQEGRRGLAGIHQSIEANLQLAAHAETWEWKEVKAGSATADKVA